LSYTGKFASASHFYQE